MHLAGGKAATPPHPGGCAGAARRRVMRDGRLAAALLLLLPLQTHAVLLEVAGHVLARQTGHAHLLQGEKGPGRSARLAG